MAAEQNLRTSRTAVIAFGGNALIECDDHNSIADQYQAVINAVPAVAALACEGWRVVVTHGNGPQVGFIMRRSELAAGELPPVPIDYAVGDTQGAIGSMFVRALSRELSGWGIPVTAVVTHAVVDAGDPAFDNPAKPVGSFLSREQAEAFRDANRWTIASEDGIRWRRTIASPLPLEILESRTISDLVNTGHVVIAGGGGGIPVIREEDGSLTGVEAVIDKDLSSCLLAIELGADLFVISTSVDRVAVNFGCANERWLDSITVDEARVFAAEGQFGSGSMAPKVTAAIDFIRANPHGRALITSPARVADAVHGVAGTVITSN